MCMCGEPYVDEMCVVVALMMIRWHLDSERVNADLRVECLCVLLLLGAPLVVREGERAFCLCNTTSRPNHWEYL